MNKVIRIHSKDLKWQPLSIPSGFEVVINDFFSIMDQGKPIFFEDDPEDGLFELYKSTLLFLKNNAKQILIDLGWAPEHNPQGYFVLSSYHMDDRYWENPLFEFRSPNKDEIVDKLNELMADVSAGKIK